jgi:hypothetical protein
MMEFTVNFNIIINNNRKMIDLPEAKWGQEKEKSYLPDNIYHSKQSGTFIL